MKFDETKQIAVFNKPVSNCDELTEYQKEIVARAAGGVSSIPVFKAKNFVGNSQITPYGAIRQYMLELSSREHQIMEMEYELEKIELAIDKTTFIKNKSNNEFDIRECDIEIRHMERKRKTQITNLASLREERLKYLMLIEEINNSQYGKLEDGTPILEAMKDEKIREKLEEDYWSKRLAKQAAMDLIAQGRIGVGNIDSIMMLDKETQKETLSLATQLLLWNEDRMVSIMDQTKASLSVNKSPDLLKLNRE